MSTLSFRNVDDLRASVDMNAPQPNIDLSGVTVFEPFALVYLGMFLRHHNSEGKLFSVTHPWDRRALAYLETQNFWNRFNFNPVGTGDTRLRRFTNSTSMNDIVDIERQRWIAEDVAEQVARVLVKNGPRIAVDAITEVASELVDNFDQHARHALAACSLQSYPQGNRVVFAIGDCGIGMRASLSSLQKYEYLSTRPHQQSILMAIEQQVTRKWEGGMGLTQVVETVVALGGRLFLSSGDGYVTVSPSGKFVGTQAYDLTGVQIELSFPAGG